MRRRKGVNVGKGERKTRGTRGREDDKREERGGLRAGQILYPILFLRKEYAFMSLI
jgi:hypothetical protein